ncbi:MAG: sigma-54-dependent Fis family transcriptional regulator [Acidobacteria bacterium]|nr:sigma-54-dependent Fis family transcriptional regulator [Acidobacteriota bacterium]
MKKILVVDDDRASCELLGEILSAQGWEVSTADSPEKALLLSDRQKFDLVISDINLEADLSGLDLLPRLREKSPVILVTGFGSLETAIEATREGAWDFISKPFKVDEIVATAKRALEQNREKDEEIVTENISSGPMVGRSPKMIELYKEIARVAPTRSTVLILGESGTGKELVARAIHQNSPRKDGPFIAVNCGALTESLLEAELFGHMKGSFTGATGDRRGLWEEADGGTLFLDEIGETSLAMQVKLLRALQEGEIRRVGSTVSRRVDARIIAATNRDLEEEVRNGSFREDLFYRLSVVTLRVPPLRERPTDISILVEKFLLKARRNVGREHLRFSDEALKTLQIYEWKGNVRELEAAVEYAALRARGSEILPEDLPVKLLSDEFKQQATRFHLSQLYGDLPKLDELEKRYLLHVLEKTAGNRTRTAEILGIDRRTLYRMAERFGIALD